MNIMKQWVKNVYMHTLLIIKKCKNMCVCKMGATIYVMNDLILSVTNIIKEKLSTSWKKKIMFFQINISMYVKWIREKII